MNKQFDKSYDTMSSSKYVLKQEGKDARKGGLRPYQEGFRVKLHRITPIWKET